MSLILETRAVGPFHKNGFLLGSEQSHEGVIIDPGDEIDELLELARGSGLTLRYLLLTHGHLDHVSGLKRAREATDAKIGLHRDDLFLYERAAEQGTAFGHHIDTPPPPDFFYGTDKRLSFGVYQITVHHTPGHSPGGVCQQVSGGNDDEIRLFVGDTLFAGSIGRTDLPGGNYDTLLRSIRTTLFRFKDEAMVYPGHGRETTIGEERRTNPFLVE